MIWNSTLFLNNSKIPLDISSIPLVWTWISIPKSILLGCDILGSVFFLSARINPRWSKEAGWRRKKKKTKFRQFHSNMTINTYLGVIRASFIVLKYTLTAFSFTSSFQINSNSRWSIIFDSNNFTLVVISFLL